jgi:hypothetical protein
MPHDPHSPFARAAGPLADADPGSLGALLVRFARRRDLDDNALAAAMGCQSASLTELMLYRANAAGLDDVAKRYGLPRAALALLEAEERARVAEERQRVESEEEADASRTLVAEDAAWQWFLGFAERIPQLRESAHAMEYLRRCADRQRPAPPPLPTGRAWYTALPAYPGRDVISIARSFALYGATRPWVDGNIFAWAAAHYPPASCVAADATPLAEYVRLWNDGTVVRLATAAIAGDGTAIALLTDALLDAGCQDEAPLTHLRQPGPHPPWCGTLCAAATPVTRKEGAFRAPKVAPPSLGATFGARKLKGVRLGQRERFILLDLADDFGLVERSTGIFRGRHPSPADDTRSGEEIMRRALLRLEALGLVHSVGGRPALTALGRTVVTIHRKALHTGARIRWGEM